MHYCRIILGVLIGFLAMAGDAGFHHFPLETQDHHAAASAGLIASSKRAQPVMATLKSPSRTLHDTYDAQRAATPLFPDHFSTIRPFSSLLALDCMLTV